MKKTCLMTHIVGGYPNMEECEKIAISMAETGVSYLEIQIPFSDPIADGKTILSANMEALDKGVTVDDCFALLRRLKKKIDIPVLFMTYYNIPFHYGVEKFCKKAKEVGCYGFIIPDMPFDEEKNDHYLELCEKYDLNAIQVISQITPIDRSKKISKVANGFVYCVSTAGTTGERAGLNKKVVQYVRRVRKYIKIPIAIGFGVSNKEHVDFLRDKVDIIVIGSKILNIYNNSPIGKGIYHIKAFLRDILW